MDITCVLCGRDLRVGSRLFSDRTRVPGAPGNDVAWACGDCAPVALGRPPADVRTPDNVENAAWTVGLGPNTFP